MNVALFCIFWTYSTEKYFLPHCQLLKTRVYDFVFDPYPAATIQNAPSGVRGGRLGGEGGGIGWQVTNFRAPTKFKTTRHTIFLYKLP